MKAILLLRCALFLAASLFLVAPPARAQKSWTAAQLIEFVDSQIKLKGDDRATAEFLRGIKLTQKLEPRDVENLQGRGAGVRTVQALRKLSEDSASLAAAPPTPPPPPVKPPPSPGELTAILAAMKEYA